jgi:plasmid stabilization system protein ParE
MKYSLEVTERAENQLWEAYRWYDARKTGLGMEWMDYVTGEIDRLADNPYIYQPYHSRYRKMVLRRFPYSVIYQVIEDEQLVIITSVIHQRRNEQDLFEE